MVRALILDVDGTLADTNGLHAEAWKRALERYGYRIPSDRICSEIGKGGDKLVPALLGNEAERRHGDQLRTAQGEEFRRAVAATNVRVVEGVSRLFDEVARRGLGSAIATSGGRENLEAIERSCGVPLSSLVDHLVTADDAERSKPAPDLVRAAFQKLGRSPAACAMIGDTIFDAESCRRAGVALLGVQSGLATHGEMAAAGARGTWSSLADLVANLDDALAIASPLEFELTGERIEEIVAEALDAAREAMASGEVPIGAVVANRSGVIVARGYNRQRASGRATDHAEIVTLGLAFDHLPHGTRDLILASTLEPCVMCTGAAMLSGVDVLLYALEAPADSGTRRVRAPESTESRMPRIIGEVMAQESKELFKEWLHHHANPEQEPYVRQLLTLTAQGGKQEGEEIEQIDEERTREQETD